MVKPLKEMFPKEWLDYQRYIHGYTKEKIPIELVRQMLCKTNEIENEILLKYSTFTKADADDRLVNILQIPLKCILSNEEKKIIDDIYFSIYPTFEVSAIVKKIPRGDKVVLIHDGLFLSLSRMSQLQLYEVEWNDNDFIKANYDQIIEHLLSVSNLWNPNSKIKENKTIKTKTSKFRKYSGALTHASILFVLGHEYGHILSNHPSYNNDQNFNHRMEFEADTWGCKLLIRHIMLNGVHMDDNVVLNYLLLGPFLTFGLIAMIKNKESLTHPSPSNRMTRFKKKFIFNITKEIQSTAWKKINDAIDIDSLNNLLDIGEKMFLKHIEYGKIINKINQSKK